MSCAVPAGQEDSVGLGVAFGGELTILDWGGDDVFPVVVGVHDVDAVTVWRGSAGDTEMRSLSEGGEGEKGE